MSAARESLLEMLAGPAPCDDCRHSTHCAATGELCAAFAAFVDGRLRSIWRRLPREPDAALTARAAAALERAIAEERREEKRRHDREVARRWREANRERIRAYGRAAYHALASDPAKVAKRREYHRAWMRAHPEKARQYQRTYNAKHRGGVAARAPARGVATVSTGPAAARTRSIEGARPLASA